MFVNLSCVTSCLPQLLGFSIISTSGVIKSGGSFDTLATCYILPIRVVHWIFQRENGEIIPSERGL